VEVGALGAGGLDVEAREERAVSEGSSSESDVPVAVAESSAVDSGSDSSVDSGRVSVVRRVVCWVGAVLDAGSVGSSSDCVAEGVSSVAESSSVGWAAVAEGRSVSGLEVGSSGSELAGREGEDGSLVADGL
jgi:hypothetical protein